MANKKNPPQKSRGPHLRLGTTLSTVSAPSTLPPQAPRPLLSAPGAEALDVKQGGTEKLSAAMPFNKAKTAEHGEVAPNGMAEASPPTGQSVSPPAPIVGASTVR